MTDEIVLFNWTPGAIIFVKDHWRDMTGRAIAAELGCSRSAALAMVYRLRKKGEIPAAERPPLCVKVPVEKKKSTPVTAYPPSVEQEALTLEGGNHVTLETMQSGKMCAWPVGDPLRPDFHYCGQKPVDGESYCTHHLLLRVAPSEREKLRGRLAAAG